MTSTSASFTLSCKSAGHPASTVRRRSGKVRLPCDAVRSPRRQDRVKPRSSTRQDAVKHTADRSPKAPSRARRPPGSSRAAKRCHPERARSRPGPPPRPAPASGGPSRYVDARASTFRGAAVRPLSLCRHAVRPSPSVRLSGVTSCPSVRLPSVCRPSIRHAVKRRPPALAPFDRAFDAVPLPFAPCDQVVCNLRVVCRRWGAPRGTRGSMAEAAETPLERT